MIYTDKEYDTNFYTYFHDSSTSSAEVIVPIILSMFPVSSVIDVGCGIGTWLRAFSNHGINDYIGIDGSYVPREMLKIPHDRFWERDLTELQSVGRRFDLACSLEVAEHLPEECAAQFVALLTDAAPVVMFSAAVPHQGGNHHVNEQWQSYWMELFAARGYKAFDCVRPLVYGNPAVDWWYRQNAIVYCDEACCPNDIAPLASHFEADRLDAGLVNVLREQIDKLTSDNSIRNSVAAIRRDFSSLRRALIRRLIS